MITLYNFGPAWGLPDPSPFVIKAEVLLKMSGVAFSTARGTLNQAPKGKIPFIEEDGKKIGDSTLIRLHLETKYNINFDSHLSTTEKGIAWAVEKMLEDHLYWSIVSERWLIDDNFHKGPAMFFAGVPAFIRPLVTMMVRRGLRKNLHAQGLGRHSRAELIILSKRAIDALAQVLSDKPYLMGAQKCGADATAFAFVICMLCPLFDTELRTYTGQYQNLVAYSERMKTEFYPNG